MCRDVWSVDHQQIDRRASWQAAGKFVGTVALETVERRGRVEYFATSLRWLAR